MRDITGGDFHDSFAKRQQEPITATPTHLAGLNRLCRDDGGGIGFARGWFVTVAGNPGFGKSTMALNLASAAAEYGERVGYISLEMTVGQLAARFYSIHTGEPISHLERGNFKPETWERAKKHMEGLPSIYIPKRISGEWEEVAGFMRDCLEEGCRWFVLDYLQLIQMGDEDKIYRAITELVTDIRAWAANEGVTIVVLSQFNRNTSAEYRLKPRSQGVWGGMIIEASSDLVLLLDHSRYERSTTNPSIARTWVILDKNRHGPVGEIPIMWDYKTLSMTEGATDRVDDWP